MQVLNFLEHYSLFQILVVMALTTCTALAAHWGKAVFHDGIRPIIPEVLEKRMKREELSSISFGLSIGFIVSVGLSFAVSFQLLNPWLLFLPTDILGVAAGTWWMAAGMGAIWGIVVILGLGAVTTIFTALPVDLLGALGELSDPVLIAFTVFPFIAILSQFGKVRALISVVVALAFRQFLPIISAATMNHSLAATIGGFTMQVAVLTLVGMIFLFCFSISQDRKARKSSNEAQEAIDIEEENSFDVRSKRMMKDLPLLAGIGALLAMASNIGVFTGSDFAGPILQKAWAASGQEQTDLLYSAAVVDIIRALSFLPLIATTALATGVSGVAGLIFVFPIGYLSPNPLIAAILGAILISVEVVALRRIGRFLQRYPTLRESSDHIRSTMNTLLELSLFIGCALAAMKMAPDAFGLSLTIYILLYAANEGLGQPIMKLAAGPVAIILTGILLNIFHFLNLI